MEVIRINDYLRVRVIKSSDGIWKVQIKDGFDGAHPVILTFQELVLFVSHLGDLVEELDGFDACDSEPIEIQGLPSLGISIEIHPVFVSSSRIYRELQIKRDGLVVRVSLRDLEMLFKVLKELEQKGEEYHENAAAILLAGSNTW